MNMKNTDYVINQLVQLALADSDEGKEKIRDKLREFVKNHGQREMNPEALVRDILLDLGAVESNIGHRYLVKAILLCIEDDDWIINITHGLYPEIARCFCTTPSKVERGIRHVIENIWVRGDFNTIDYYFRNSVDADRCKPTNSQFVARITNIVRMQLMSRGKTDE